MNIQRAAVPVLIMVVGLLCACAHRSQPARCGPECQQRRQWKAECEAGDPVSCQVLGEHERACKLGMSLGCMGAADRRDPRMGRLDASAPEAARYYQLSCEAGNLHGCVQAAAVLIAWPGSERGHARTLLERACEESAIEACMQDRRSQWPATQKLAEDFLRDPCDEASSDACRQLSLDLADGLDGPADETRARELMVGACDEDDVEACFWLGYYSYAGIGAPRDLEGALAFFHRSCLDGSGNACNAHEVLEQAAAEGTARVLGRLLDEERHIVSHRMTQPLPLAGSLVEIFSFVSVSGSVNARGRMNAVDGQVIEATANRLRLRERRSSNILRSGYTRGSLVLLKWSPPVGTPSSDTP